MGSDNFHYNMLLTALSNQDLNTSKEWTLAAFLGDQFQCVTTLTMKTFLISNLNLNF